MADYTFRETQQIVDDWIKTVGNGYWSPHEMLARLIEEVGETARLINHLHGTKKKKPTEAEQNLPTELTDMIFAIICLANIHEIDLQQAFEKMMETYKIRDHNRFDLSKNQEHSTSQFIDKA